MEKEETADSLSFYFAALESADEVFLTSSGFYSRTSNGDKQLHIYLKFFSTGLISNRKLCTYFYLFYISPCQ